MGPLGLGVSVYQYRHNSSSQYTLIPCWFCDIQYKRPTKNWPNVKMTGTGSDFTLLLWSVKKGLMYSVCCLLIRYLGYHTSKSEWEIALLPEFLEPLKLFLNLILNKQARKTFSFFSSSFQSTSNYHARKFGVRAAMPGFIAKKLCPALVIVPTNFDRYRAASKEVRCERWAAHGTGTLLPCNWTTTTQ